MALLVKFTTAVAGPDLTWDDLQTPGSCVAVSIADTMTTVSSKSVLYASRRGSFHHRTVTGATEMWVKVPEVSYRSPRQACVPALSETTELMAIARCGKRRADEEMCRFSGADVSGTSLGVTTRSHCFRHWVYLPSSLLFTTFREVFCSFFLVISYCYVQLLVLATDHTHFQHDTSLLYVIVNSPSLR